MRTQIAWGLLALALVAAASATASTTKQTARPTLTLVQRMPLVVRGAHFRPGDGDWTLGVVATNLLDKKVPSARNPGTGGMGIDSYTVGRPREIGVEVRRTF